MACVNRCAVLLKDVQPPRGHSLLPWLHYSPQNSRKRHTCVFQNEFLSSLDDGWLSCSLLSQMTLSCWVSRTLFGLHPHVFLILCKFLPNLSSLLQLPLHKPTIRSFYRNLYNLYYMLQLLYYFFKYKIKN